MSSLEPQTSAKVRIYTTKGNLDIELWAKETPKTSRIFLENILNQRFKDWSFNRILRDFIIQADGSLSEELFEDEFSTRIRFNKRGVIGSVNMNSKNSNTGKFFITLKETPELNNKNTAFGKIVGDSIFSVVKISEGQLNEDGETPLYPVKIVKTEVLIPYFDDLKQAEVQKEGIEAKAKDKKKTKKKTKVKLSLDEDLDDGDVDIKMKSAHDVLDDKKLSKQSVKQFIEITEEQRTKKQADNSNHTLEESVLEPKPVPEIPEPEKEITDQETTVDTKEVESNKPFKQDKKLRELETLRLLESFDSKISQKAHDKPITKISEHKSTKRSDSILDEFDEDFDNLDGSDSDSDIYSHSLRFEENEENNKLENEDLLITIDEKQSQSSKRGANEFYRNQQVNSIASKKLKR